MTDEPAEILELYLDGELPAHEASAVQRRLAAEPALAAQLEESRALRALRAGFFAAIEPDDAAADRAVENIRRRIGRPLHPGPQAAPDHATLPWQWIRIGIAAAACLAVAFMAGRVARLGNIAADRQQGAPVPVSYQVSITDESGAVLGIQKFKSLEEAREFSDDLHRWQERQEKLLSGQITLRSGSF